MVASRYIVPTKPNKTSDREEINGLALHVLPSPGTRHFVGALTVALGARAQPSDEAIWKNFMEWLNKAPPVDGPRILVELYYKDLIASGASEAEATREIAVVRQMHRQRSDGWRVMFNNIYKTTNPGFATQPNALLVSTVEGRKTGRALDVGMGQGRNSVFLALKGWDVTGFDMSDEGIATARKNAESAGVKLNAIRETEDAFDYGTGQWDLIVFMYEPFPVTSAAYVERLRQSMRPSSIIVIESFREEEEVKSRPSTAIDPGRLLTAFRDFRLLHYQDVVAKADWGLDERRLVRMVAERPR
jgi:SAM-dependent methyltransferase